jgi:hypothetical protein
MSDDQSRSNARGDDRVTINKEFESFDAFIEEYVTNMSRTGRVPEDAQPLPHRHAVNLRSP